MAALNPLIEIVTVRARLTDANATDILRGADVVVDATDNFDARYVINRACVALKVCILIYIYIYVFTSNTSVYLNNVNQCFFKYKHTICIIINSTLRACY